MSERCWISVVSLLRVLPQCDEPVLFSNPTCAPSHPLFEVPRL